MGRLHALIAVGVWLAACDSGIFPDRSGRVPTVTQERAVAVAASEAPALDPLLSRFCDVSHGEGEGPVFVAPESVPAIEAAPPGAWTWINVWATWCVPCVREMPGLVAELQPSPVALRFVSADDDASAVHAFAAGAGLSMPLPVLNSPSDQTAALAAGAGLPGDAALPLHLLVDPAGRLRCARVGEAAPSDVRDFLGAIGAPSRRRIR